MCTSWIDHYCADLNRDPDTYLSKKSIFHLLIPSDLNYEKEKYRNDRFRYVRRHRTETSNQNKKSRFIFSDFQDFICEEGTC